MTKYKLDNVDKFTIGLLLSITVGIILLLSGCNVEKKAQKKFDKAYKASPKVVEQNLAKLFPPKPPIIRRGATIKVKDTAALRNLQNSIDSLNSLPPKILTVQDSCGKENNDGYNEGFKIGVKVGRYEGLFDCEANTIRTDSFFQDTKETLILLKSTQDSLETAQKQAISDNATISKQKDKISQKNVLFLSFLSLFLLSALGNVLQFKFKTKKLA